MRTLWGTVRNLDDSFLCKVSHNSGERSVDQRELWQLINIIEESTPKVARLSKVEKQTSISNNPTFEIGGDGYLLHDGDIILLETSGRGTVLYEAVAQSNALIVTEECNNFCIMCSQPPRKQNDSFLNVNEQIIGMIDASPDVLCLTGGEPTVVWDEFLRLVKTCKNRFHSTSIQLLTNARRLKNYTLAKELADAGHNNLYVCIPLYSDVESLHDEIVGSSGAFWDTLEGIYNLARLNVRLEIRTVIMKQNYERLLQWAEFIYHSMPFVSHVALMGLEPIGMAIKNIKKVWIDPLDYIKEITKAVRSFQRYGLDASIYNHQLCTIPKNIWNYCQKSISEWKRIYLPSCELCREKQSCGGLFHSGAKHHSKGIHPIT